MHQFLVHQLLVHQSLRAILWPSIYSFLWTSISYATFERLAKKNGSSSSLAIAVITIIATAVLLVVFVVATIIVIIGCRIRKRVCSRQRKAMTRSTRRPPRQVRSNGAPPPMEEVREGLANVGAASVCLDCKPLALRLSDWTALFARHTGGHWTEAREVTCAIRQPRGLVHSIGCTRRGCTQRRSERCASPLCRSPWRLC